MQKLLLIMLCFSQSIFAADEKWNAFHFSFGGLGGLGYERDSCIRVMVKPEKGSELSFGPILLWKSKGRNDIIQITNSLSALSKAIGEIVSEMPEADQRIAIRNAIGNYCRSIRSTVLVGEEREQALEEITKKDSKRAADLAILAPDIVEQWSPNTWQLAFCIISEEGAVEKHSFSGMRAPFAINRHETELIKNGLTRG